MRLFWTAIVVLAALLPIAPIVVCAILVAICLFAPAAVSQLPLIADPSDAQPVALLALSLFRAPPAQLV